VVCDGQAAEPEHAGQIDPRGQRAGRAEADAYHPDPAAAAHELVGTVLGTLQDWLNDAAF